MWILVLKSSALSVGPYVVGLARHCHFEMGKTPLPPAPRLPHRLKSGHQLTKVDTVLLHIKHHHDPTTCPGGDEERRQATFGSLLPALETAGITVVGAWTDPPAHDFFLIVETDSYEDLLEGMRPIIPAGSAIIQPVVDMRARMQVPTTN